MRPTFQRRASEVRVYTEGENAREQGSLMPEVLDLKELEERPAEMVERVVRDRTEVILARNGRPEVALVSYEELVRLRQLEERERNFLERWEQMRERMAALNDCYDDDEVAAEVEAARQEVRAARRGS